MLLKARGMGQVFAVEENHLDPRQILIILRDPEYPKPWEFCDHSMLEPCRISSINTTITLNPKPYPTRINALGDGRGRSWESGMVWMQLSIQETLNYDCHFSTQD